MTAIEGRGRPSAWIELKAGAALVVFREKDRVVAELEDFETLEITGRPTRRRVLDVQVGFPIGLVIELAGLVLVVGFVAGCIIGRAWDLGLIP